MCCESLQFLLFEFVLLIEERLALRELTKKKNTLAERSLECTHNTASLTPNESQRLRFPFVWQLPQALVLAVTLQGRSLAIHREHFII
jgi:hypothetical protein